MHPRLHAVRVMMVAVMEMRSHPFQDRDSLETGQHFSDGGLALFWMDVIVFSNRGGSFGQTRLVETPAVADLAR